MTAPAPRRSLPCTVGGGLAVIAALAGCSSPVAATRAPATTGGATAAAPAAGSSGSGTPTYRDGTYSADGRYQSPGGPAEVGVTLTLRDDVVTAVTVTPKAADATAQRYESAFASGIQGVVVGKRIDDLHVGAVSGSSLTAQGFDAAVTTIERAAA